MNNRQAGRRRGRGGQRPQGNANSNSRIDSRQRGNASQLYEKYKNLARDTQMAGDRVNTEYYLQFADHYFRVLNENRSRFEENRRQRDDADGDEDIDGDDDFDQRDNRDAQRDNRGTQRDNRDNRDEQRPEARGNGHARDASDDEERDQRQARRQERPIRANGAAPRSNDAPAPADQIVRGVEGEPGTEAEVAPPKRGRGRPRKPRPEEAEASAAIEADRLPPSLTTADEPNEEKPRRRRGRPAAAESAGASS